MTSGFDVCTTVSRTGSMACRLELLLVTRDVCVLKIGEGRYPMLLLKQAHSILVLDWMMPRAIGR